MWGFLFAARFKVATTFDLALAAELGLSASRVSQLIKRAERMD
jgi:hypothetical protein